MNGFLMSGDGTLKYDYIYEKLVKTLNIRCLKL